MNHRKLSASKDTIVEYKNDVSKAIYLRLLLWLAATVHIFFSPTTSELFVIKLEAFSLQGKGSETEL